MPVPNSEAAIHADTVKLTGSVTQTIENAKKKIEGMPHAKKELSPLWGLLAGKHSPIQWSE
jgi:hypothetical protein